MKRNRCNGFTLLETAIALAVFLLLSVSASAALVYVSRSSERLMVTQNVFENARASLDALTVNIQMAEKILLETDADDVLKKLTLTERDPDGKLADYFFYFKRGAGPEEAKYHRLEFGLNAEFASHIASVKITYENERRMDITVVTDDFSGPPMTCSGSVDVRYKQVTVEKP